VRTLVETGVLVGAPGAYRLVQALPTIQVPATVQAVLAARIDRLPPEDKRLLQTAAATGTEVPLPLLQAIAELPKTPCTVISRTSRRPSSCTRPGCFPSASTPSSTP
jgi:predicted ATPase